MFEEKLFKSLSISAKLGQRSIATELKQYNINGAEYLFLVTLASHDGLSQSQLCDVLCLDPALATRAFRSMLKKGFITREKNPLDSREYIHRLTEEGKRLEPIIQQAISHWESILLEGISEKSQEKLSQQLLLMSQNALTACFGASQRKA